MDELSENGEVVQEKILFEEPEWLLREKNAESFQIDNSNACLGLENAREGLLVISEPKNATGRALKKWFYVAGFILGASIPSFFQSNNNQRRQNACDCGRNFVGKMQPNAKKSLTVVNDDDACTSPEEEKQRIWKRLFSGEFDLNMFPKNYQNLIARKAEIYSGDCEEGERCIRDQLERALKRAGPYLNVVRKMVIDSGLPEVFAYLAFTESMWNSDIMSHAGAYGIVQFMPETAKWIGFKMQGEFSYFREKKGYPYKGKEEGKDVFEEESVIEKYGQSRAEVYLYDQRRDIIVAHQKKIEYLQRLKNDYEGDSAILAAFRYNFGPGNIARIMRPVNNILNRLPEEKRTKKRMIAEFLKLNGNKESYNYVANLMAFAQVVSGMAVDNPDWIRAESVVSEELTFPIIAEKVDLPAGGTVIAIANQFGINYRAILEASKITELAASNLPIGKELTVPIPRQQLVTPGMIRIALGMGMEFYDLNPGIHDPRRKIAEISHSYKFEFQVRAGDTIETLYKNFAARGITKKALISAAGDSDLKVGQWLSLEGKFEESNDLENDAFVNDSVAAEIEQKMPPVPNGWLVHFPTDKKALWQKLLEAQKLR